MDQNSQCLISFWWLLTPLIVLYKPLKYKLSHSNTYSSILIDHVQFIFTSSFINSSLSIYICIIIHKYNIYIHSQGVAAAAAAASVTAIIACCYYYYRHCQLSSSPPRFHQSPLFYFNQKTKP
ncbi:hypothetical protein QVD17_05727 [Tagetes erecta]|uniref:Transmembrane protein n=1 Tax=Tagetes erecta TaxID=13708 RepID=A0AAD8LKC4_TARER|nr:hypothetical protein QVD17_05727 [Tagetes erecta]